MNMAYFSYILNFLNYSHASKFNLKKETFKTRSRKNSFKFANNELPMSFNALSAEMLKPFHLNYF